MEMYDLLERADELRHYGIRGQRKGIRRWTNADGTLNEAGKRRYYDDYGNLNQRAIKEISNAAKKTYDASYKLRPANSPKNSEKRQQEIDAIKKDLDRQYAPVYQQAVKNNPEIAKKEGLMNDAYKKYLDNIDKVNGRKIDMNNKKDAKIFNDYTNARDEYSNAKEQYLSESYNTIKAIMGDYGKKDLKSAKALVQEYASGNVRRMRVNDIFNDINERSVKSLEGKTAEEHYGKMGKTPDEIAGENAGQNSTQAIDKIKSVDDFDEYLDSVYKVLENEKKK